MCHSSKFATRLLSAALSIMLALISIGAVTDTAFARPQLAGEAIGPAPLRVLVRE